MKAEPKRSDLELLSVVIPARDEEDCIASTVEHLHFELRLHDVPHEIVVVDDGSSDRTWNILEQLKLRLPNLANKFLQLFFRLEHNDITNEFKAYRKTTIDGCRPLRARHFNLTVEIPLKAVVRGYTWKSLPITWRNRRSGDTKLKIKEMGSGYLLTCLHLWLEQYLA